MYQGPPIDDHEILAWVPAELRRLLERVNGYVAYDGGLHLRGACTAPEWHSLRAAWTGPDALHRLFPAVRPDDVPFAEDALGDQYLARNGVVHRLSAETGEVESLEMDLPAFDEAVRADPVEALSLHPLEEFRARGGVLEPGELLSVYPPFVAAESAEGVTYRAVPAGERIRWLAELARSIADLPEGGRLEIIPRP